MKLVINSPTPRHRREIERYLRQQKIVFSVERGQLHVRAGSELLIDLRHRFPVAYESGWGSP